MTFMEKITGSDMTKEFKGFEARVKKLPADYQVAWEKVKNHIWPHSDFTGRNLMSVLEGVVDLFEETAADGLNVREVLGDDVESFCSELIGEESSKSFRNTWRKQLNNNIARKLGK